MVRAVLCRHGAVTWDLGQALTSIATSLDTTCSSHALSLIALSVIGQVTIEKPLTTTFIPY